MAQNTVTELIKEISGNLSQSSSSRKDEVRIMQAMLSDADYEVSIYGKDGIEGTYNPAKDFRSMCASIISNAAKVPIAEANQIMADYTVRKSEAESAVRISKEFVNTFLQTNRKLPLGARETSDIALGLKKVEATTRTYPQKVGVNDDGTDRYSKVCTTIPAHDSIRVYSPCPVWVK